MRYSWDQRKNRINLIKHGVAFDDACHIFDGAVLEQVDDRFNYGEERIYAIGVVHGVEITVIYTDPDDEERRLIAAWRSTPSEIRAYWKKIGH